MIFQYGKIDLSAGIFKAEITPVFAKGIFVPYFGGLGFGYKF